jgi:hypothetical protein
MSIKLLDVAKYFTGLPRQVKALEWFDASTGQQKQQVFARLYRNQSNDSNISAQEIAEEPDINFVDAFKYFEGIAWQINALNWLQVNTVPATLEEFARLWRSGPPPPKASSASDYWKQITHNQTRLPHSQQERSNLERACDMLQELEKHLGVPLNLTSGFRPEPINSQVGGVPGFYHTTGLAADVYSDRMDDFELEQKLIQYWFAGGRGGVGRGMSYRGFVHVDLGPVRIWDY